MKKYLTITSLFIFIYLSLGAVLLRAEIIQRLYIFPYWSIKYGSTDEENSGVSADGPIIIYENNSIFNYQILQKKKQKIIKKQEIKKSDLLHCTFTNSKVKFKFKLKKSITIPECEYNFPNKMLVISDIEGNFEGLKLILQGNKIINDDFKWTFGNNHLILLGDFFDRGTNVTECLWLIYKLEEEAEKKGGKVHFILGNHEVMNMKGQLKYVRNKYKENADTLKLDYNKWYSKNAELGHWLRSKNSVEKIGNLLFTHGGIHKNLAKNYTIEEINNITRSTIDKKTMKNDLFLGENSPLWYRGIAKEEESQEDLENTLSQYNVQKLIIGHTLFEQMHYKYNEKVICIDVNHQKNIENGKMYALWIENQKFYITNHLGNKINLQ